MPAEAQSPAPTQVNTEAQALAALKAKRTAATQPVEPTTKPVDAPQEAPEQEAPVEADGEVVAEPDSDGVVENNEQGTDEAEPTISFKVDGEVEEIPLSEAQKLLSSAKSIIKQQNKVAEERQQVQSKLKETEAVQARYVQQLAAMADMMNQNLPQVPSQALMQQWLNSGDVVSYTKGKEAIETYRAIQSERQRVQQQMQHQQAQKFEEHLSREAEKLVKLRPDFNNPEYTQKVSRFLSDDFGVDAKWAAENVTDAWMWEVIDDARKYREGNKNRSEALKKAFKAPRAIPSSTPQTVVSSNEQKRAEIIARVKNSTSADAAVNALRALRQR
jgi:hypothetical protein